MKSFLAKISTQHTQFFNRPWLHSSTDKRFIIGAAVLILLASLINFDIRDRQWSAWQDIPQLTFLDDLPMVSTTDAAHYLIFAENVINDDTLNHFDHSRLYPEQTEAYRQKHDPDYVPSEQRATGYTDVPMLSAVIAWTAQTFFDDNVLMAGHAMIAISAFITVAAIGAMFWVAGYPLEGALAGLGLGLSTSYIGRTSVGRIDTDQMIVAFLAVNLLLVLLAAREKNIPRIIGYAILAAAFVHLGLWWHSGTKYLMLIPILMVLSSLLMQQDIKRAAIAGGAFILAFNPLNYITSAFSFLNTVFGMVTGTKPSAPETGSSLNLVFPDTYKTITEQARIDLFATLESMTGHTAIGVIGLVGFLVWSLVRPSRAVVFLPFVVLGLLSVVVGRRYAFFAAPFIWFGFGWLILTACRYVMTLDSIKKALSARQQDYVTLGLGVVLVIGMAAVLNKNYVPRPTFSKEVTKTFRDIGTIAGEESGIIATWWDYGYYAHFHSGGMATIHDGGSQNTPRTHLFARGLVSSNTGELIQITKFLATGGQAAINANGRDIDTLNQAMARAGNPDKPIYLAITNQMIDWSGSIATLGRFNPVKGQYLPGKVLQQQYTVINLSCKQAPDNKLDCNHGLVDFTHGTLNGNPIINQIIVTSDGRITGTEQRHAQAPYNLVINKLSNSGATRIKLVHRVLWNSTLFQLLEHGQYDKERLELVLDQYPYSRVYRIIR